MAVITSLLRNRWKARFQRSKGRFSYPPGK
jgi:hypothetical protein